MQDGGQPADGQEEDDKEDDGGGRGHGHAAAPPPQPQAVPRDERHAAYAIFFALGAGFLLPWNAFITAADYFEALYPGAHVDRVFAVAYMLPDLAVLWLFMLYGRRMSARCRIVYGFAAFLALLAVVPLLDATLVHGNRGTVLTLSVTVAAVAGTGVADAVVQGSLYGIAGELPAHYTQALVGGTSASGVIVSFLRILTKAALPSTTAGLRASANLYFAVSGAFILGCLVGYHRLVQLPVIRYYQALRAAPVESLLLLSEDSLEARHMPGGPWCKDGSEKATATSSGMGEATSGGRQPIYHSLLRQLWPLAGAMVLVYVVTLSIFPGFLAEDVKSEVLGDWYPVLLIALFNVCDLAGKVMPWAERVQGNVALVGGPVLRLLFYPAFYSCLHGPQLLRGEVPIVVLTACLGLTNGFFTSALMMVGPKRVKSYEAESAAILLVLCLVLGLTIGALSGVLWVL
eukprot:SM000008S22163  [mRNA]  locus=s8:166887:168596:- [translate_table: standard]